MPTYAIPLPLVLLSAATTASGALLVTSAHRSFATASSPVRRFCTHVTAQLDDNELDAGDTTSSWDAELAEMRAWEMAQAAKKGAAAPASDFFDSGTGVDEDAHFGLGDDDDDDDDTGTALSILRQMETKAGIGGADRDAESDKRIMTSLSSVLSAVSRLSDKLDRLESKVDKLLKAPPAASSAAAPPSTPGTPTSSSAPAPSAPSAPSIPSAPKPGEWDGQVDEEAWFDDDPDEDFPDWRDVRKLKRMLEATEEAEPPPPDEE